jgi:capsular exopolysaccharide synthesis family protein
MNDLRSYLLVLRKYWIVVAAVVVVTAAGGWIWGRCQKPTWGATALVQIKQRPSTWLGNSELWVDEDRRFLADQVYRIRQDTVLARRVVERVRSWVRDGRLPAEWGAGIDVAALARAVEGLRPEGLPRRVSVTPVEQTSYYSVQVTGTDVPLLVALSNAYVDEIVDLFREEGLRSVKGQVEGWEKEWLDRRDRSRDRLDTLRGELARLQAENPGVDGVRRTIPARLDVEPARRALFEARESLEGRREELRNAVDVLRAEGLSFRAPEPGAAGSPALVSARAAGAERDPRLSASVQALPAVARDENVRWVLGQLRAQDDLDRTVAAKYSEESAERKTVRRRKAELEADLALRTEAALGGLARAVEEDGTRATRLEGRVAALDAKAGAEAVLLARMDELDKKVGDVQREIDSYDAHLAEAARLRKALIEAGVSVQDMVRKIQGASASEAVLVAPDMARIWTFTAIACVIAAIAVLQLLLTLDDTVKSREDYDRLVRGLPLFGVVPAIPGNDSDGLRLVALDGLTGTPAVESFRALRTTLQHSGNGKTPRVLLLTSSGPREGKTTLSTNLAASFARGGQRTLLIDGDLRRPRVHRVTGRENLVGLSSLLSGESSLAEAVIASPDEPNLFVLAAGPIPPDPSELLASPRLRATIREACASYDRVLIDSPPIVSVTDPCILALEVDVLILVIAHARTSTRLIRRARECVEAVGGKVHGTVINNASPGRGFYGDAYYKYAYRYHTYGEGSVRAGTRGLPS